MASLFNLKQSLQIMSKRILRIPDWSEILWIYGTLFYKRGFYVISRSAEINSGLLPRFIKFQYYLDVKNRFCYKNMILNKKIKTLNFFVQHQLNHIQIKNTSIKTSYVIRRKNFFDSKTLFFRQKYDIDYIGYCISAITVSVFLCK